MSARATSRAVLFAVWCAFTLVWHGAAVGQEPPTPEASAPPDLPPDVTLAQLVARQKVNCSFIGAKLVKHTVGPAFSAPLDDVMPKLMSLQPTSLDAMAAAPNASSCTKSLCAFVKKANCPSDLAEAMIRANCKEKIYKNCDLIDAAAKTCSPERVARWRSQYPDNP